MAQSQALDADISAGSEPTRAAAIKPLLTQALEHRAAGRHHSAAKLALQALSIDDRCSVAWHVLALCQEAADDPVNALKCYDAALKLDPENTDVACNLGRLAFHMGQKDLAEQLFRHVLALSPNSPGAANNLACVLRDRMRYAESIAVSRSAITASPHLPLLWDTLATTLTEQGDIADALPFYDEALRLDPTLAAARYNRANARFSLGDPVGALPDCERAIGGASSRADAAMMGVTYATMLLAAGDLERGWDAYEARNDPDYVDSLQFEVDRPCWTPGTDLDGRSLLLVGEQGLGDELLFASVIPDVLDALGPTGGLTLAAAPRLVGLFQRSFPAVRLGHHQTARVGRRNVRAVHVDGDAADIELWAPMGSMLRSFRRSLAAFPDRPGYLRADADRIAHWRCQLGALDDRPKIGLVWKSIKVESARTRAYAPFDAWRPILGKPGLRFVNLQYGPSSEEVTYARDALGVEIWTPPDLDLKDDLDGVAALACALNLTIGPVNATTNLAAACGAPVWIVSPPGYWHKLGTSHYPWHPRIRAFSPSSAGRWDTVMSRVAAELEEVFPPSRAVA